MSDDSSWPQNVLMQCNVFELDRKTFLSDAETEQICIYHEQRKPYNYYQRSRKT